MERQSKLRSRFLDCRKLSEAICEPLEVEDYIPQPIVDVSPPKWHLGHTTWFFETFVLAENFEEYNIYHEDFAFLFNSYYNNAGERVLRPNRGLMSRPPVREVMAYRQHVTEAVLDYLPKITDSKLLDILELGINHEQQHQELLIYDIKYILGNQPTFPVYGEGYELQAEIQEQEWLTIEKGVFKIGASGKDFCYDNECSQHEIYLAEYSIAKNLVTNNEYIEFIEDGGYQNFNFWLSEGWDWVNQNQIVAPLYWYKKNDIWYNYTLQGFKEVEGNVPVQHISFYEALAFAEWKGHRLPTEFEWEVAASKFDWGHLWEWTYSAYQPYPGFQKAPGALGEYNGKFMINQNVLRGASVATSPDHSRISYRNFFHASSRWLFSGIRLAK